MKRLALVLSLLLAILGVWIASRQATMRIDEQTSVRPQLAAEKPPAPRQRDPDEGNDAANRMVITAPSGLEQPAQDAGASQPSEPPKVSGPAATHLSDPETWTLEFQGLSVAELQKAALALETKVQNMMLDAGAERHDRGIYEVVASGKITQKDVHAKEIATYQMGPNNELHRTVLPEDEYPELFAMNHKMKWLKAYALLAEASVSK